MSSPAFEYDVFLSFASQDQELVTPLWQDLSSNGLRVFWSDATLRERVGASWFDVVQESLDRSRHLLVVFTPHALASQWVKREYVAFFSHCYRPPERLLVPLLAGCHVGDLPLFLREVETCRLDETNIVRRLVRRFGGVDVEALRADLARRDEEIAALRSETSLLRDVVSKTRAEQAAYSASRSSAETLRRAVLARDDQITALQAEVATLEDALAKLRTEAESGTSRKELEMLRRYVATREEEIERLNAEATALNEVVLSLRGQLGRQSEIQPATPVEAVVFGSRRFVIIATSALVTFIVIVVTIILLKTV